MRAIVTALHSSAERVYREDLVQFPHNGWSLFGLTRALEAQGRIAEAAATHAAFQESWLHADVELTTTRF